MPRACEIGALAAAGAAVLLWWSSSKKKTASAMVTDESSKQKTASGMVTDETSHVTDATIAKDCSSAHTTGPVRTPASTATPSPLPRSFSYTWLVDREWLPNVSFLLKRKLMLSSSSLESLLVITDFDATITAGNSQQCHDLMGCSQLLSQTFREEFAPLLDWQSNTAIDGVEWWDRAHDLMIKHGQPPRHMLRRLVGDAGMILRPGALDLLGHLALHHVPVLIVSAGLSDVIEEFLRVHGALTENITVCSNRLNYAADSAPVSVSPDPPITSFTKATAYRSSSAFFKQHADRKTLLVLGDSLHDTDVAKDVPYDHMISVGFMNERPLEVAAKYAQTFDAIVLGNDGSLENVQSLVEELGMGHFAVSAALRAALEPLVSCQGKD